MVETDQQFARFSSEFDLADGRLTTEVGVAWSHTEQAFTGGFATEGEKVKVDLQSDLAIGADDVLTVALETEEDSAQDNTGFDFSRRTNAALVQYQLGLFDSLYLTAGMRIDDDSQYGDFLTYRVTAAYLIDATGTKLRGSVGTGFKAPTATDLTDNPAFGFIGNPDLVPEESVGFDIGIEQTLLDERLTLGLTYFHTDTENLIQIVGNTAENVGEATAQGVEAELSFSPNAQWDIGASYTWSVGENLDTDELLFRRPRHSAGLTVDYRPLDDLRLHLGVTYVGTQRDRDFSVFPAEVVTLDDYTLVTVGGSYDITPNLQVYGRVDNLLDEDYQEVFGFGTEGRTVLVGLSARL